MAPSESQLRNWIRHCRETYAETTRLREEEGVDSPRMDRGLARDAGAIGLSNLALGDPEDAREWLERAADHQERALDRAVAAAKDDPSSALVPWAWTLVCDALLLGDRERVHATLDRVADAPPRYPKLYPDNAVRLYRLLSLRSLLRGDEAATREHLAEFRRYAEAHDADDSFATTVEGFLDDDSERIAAGIRAACEHHADWIEDDPDDRAPGEGIAVNPLVMLTLAEERGYDVAVDHRVLLNPPGWKTDK